MTINTFKGVDVFGSDENNILRTTGQDNLISLLSFKSRSAFSALENAFALNSVSCSTKANNIYSLMFSEIPHIDLLINFEDLNNLTHYELSKWDYFIKEHIVGSVLTHNLINQQLFSSKNDVINSNINTLKYLLNTNHVLLKPSDYYMRVKKTAKKVSEKNNLYGVYSLFHEFHYSGT